jgi:hypothetical protein
MSTADSKSLPRSWYGLALVPLVFGASRALLKYAWWAAMHGALYGVPAEAGRLKEADANADFYLWTLIALAGTATIVATKLMPLKSQTLASSTKRISRIVLAVVLVAGLILIVAAGMSATGYFLK